MLDAIDRSIINTLQGDFPLSERPYRDAAVQLSIDEVELIRRIERLLASGVATRFGPMFNADRMGGAFSLCALAVPPERFEDVAAFVNAHPEVAHNYERRHQLNMWFVLASDDPVRIRHVVRAIEAETGLVVFDFPKLEEYFVGLRIEA